MTQDTSGESRLQRRAFLGGAVGLVASALLAACGGTAATPAAGGAAGGATTTGATAVPTTGGKRKTLLVWGRQQFLPESNDHFTESAKLAGQKGGFDVNVQLFTNEEHPQKEIVAMESGTVPDIAYTYAPALWNQNGYALEVPDLYDTIGKTGGGWLPLADPGSNVGGKRIGIPMNNEPWILHLRKDLLEAAGVKLPLTSYDQLLDAFKKVNQADKNFFAFDGQMTEADWTGNCLQFLWAFGGRTVEADGTTIAINSPETLTALNWARDFWAAACLPDGLTWDDNGNNLAYANGQIAATQNGPALYLNLREGQGDLAALTALAPFPVGPGGRGVPVTTHAHAIPAGATNATIARAFLSWFGAREQTERYLAAAAGAVVAALRGFADSPVWAADPKLRAFLDAAETGRWIGWPAAPSRAATAADANFVVVDMFAGVVAGDAPQAAITAAENALRNLAALGAGA